MGVTMKSATGSYILEQKRMRRVNERLARVQLLTAAARERALELAKQYESSPLGRRAEVHRRRLQSQ
jgi:hypothetical protein